MATRFYLHTTPVSSISPTKDAGWEGSPDNAAFHGSLVEKTGLTTLSTLNNQTTTTTSGLTEDDLVFQFVSQPIPPQNITGTVSSVVRCSEANALFNVTLAIVVRVLSQDGTAIRGTLFSTFNTDTEFPLDASAATRIVNAQAVTALTTQPGDRIVVEYGGHAAAPTATGATTIRFGSSTASDFALTSALTTDLNPWIEFSQNIWSSDTNNYQFVKVGNGMSSTEKIR